MSSMQRRPLTKIALMVGLILAGVLQHIDAAQVSTLRDADREAVFMQGKQLYDRKQWSRAVARLGKARSDPLFGPVAYILIARCYQQIGKPEQAEIQFKAALALVPDHPVACNQYGLLFRKTGKFEAARKIYEQGLARFPDYAPLHRNLGILCDLYLNDLENALAHYEIYSQAMPEDRQVKLWIADLRARLAEK